MHTTVRLLHSPSMVLYFDSASHSGGSLKGQNFDKDCGGNIFFNPALPQWVCWISGNINLAAWVIAKAFSPILETSIFKSGVYIPYARHYKPRLVFFFTQISLQLRLILQTIYVLKTEILHFLSLKSAAYKWERPQIESGLWWRAYGNWLECVEKIIRK